MSTVAEIDSKGRVVRIFHRTPTAAWTHAPGERYRYWGGRHGSPHWIEMPCSCSIPQTKVTPRDAISPGDGPEATPASARAIA